MKNKRLLLVLVFAVVILAGWMVTLRTVSGTDIIEEQKELVNEADIYKDKELYVRAIPLYEKALKLDTDSNDEIEQKLLYCYENYSDTSSYIDLVKKRDAAGTAQEQEYLTAASYYIEKSKLSSAMELLKSGIEKLGSQALTEYFEDNRYTYTVKSTKYVDVVPTKHNDVMPAYDGDKWGYINSSGKVLLRAQYDTATVFDTKYDLAVVSNDGQYYAITSDGDKYGVDDGTAYPQMTDVKTMTIGRIVGQRNGTYSYYNYDFEPIAENYQFDEITSNSCGVAAVRKGDKWGIITDSGATVVDFVLDDVAINSYDCVFVDGIAMVKENGSWHMIDTQGNTVGTATFADAKAPESSGYIAVSDTNGRWGFIDREGNQVIEYTYFDAYSFSNGLAAVQTAVEWGYISERNELVIDSLFEWAKPFHNGTSQAKLADYVQLITLKYYED
jgi:tetratricopeptide (TPR) repeat protein